MLLVVAKQRTDRFENFPMLIPSLFAFKWYAWIVVTLNPTRHSLIARYNAFALKWIRRNDYVFVCLLYCFWLLQHKFCESSSWAVYLANRRNAIERWRWQWWSIEFCSLIWKNAHLIAFTLKATTNSMRNKCEWVAKWMWRITEQSTEEPKENTKNGKFSNTLTMIDKPWKYEFAIRTLGPILYAD